MLSTRLCLCAYFLAYLINYVAYSASPYTPQSYDPFYEPWRWSKIEDFENKDLICVSEADNGNLWFGTSKGVLKFDGYEITDFPEHEVLNVSRVYDIFAFSDESVYAINESSIFWFNGQQWTEISSGTYRADTTAFASSQSNVLWIACPEGIYRAQDGQIEQHSSRNVSNPIIDYKNRLWLSELDSYELLVIPLAGDTLSPEKNWTHLKPNRKPSTTQINPYFIHFTTNGNVWVMDRNTLNPHVYYDEQLKWHQVEDLLPYGGKNIGRNVSSTSDGSVWVGSVQELYRYKNNKWTVFRSDEINGLEMPYNMFIFKELRDKSVLFGGFHSPFYKIDLSNKNWSSYHDINLHCEDKNQNQWFISRDSRVVRYNPRQDNWTSYNTDDGIIDTPLSIISSEDNTIWVSGSHNNTAAVSRLENEQWITESFPDIGDSFSYLSAYVTNDQRVIFGAGDEPITNDDVLGGLIVFTKINGNQVAEHIPSPRAPRRPVGITDIDGNLWMGGLDLYKMSPDGPFEPSPPFPSPARIWVDHIISDNQQNLWVAIWGEGVHYRQNGDWNLDTATNGLSSNGVVYLIQSQVDQSIWAATDNGISRYNGESWTKFALPQNLKIERESGTLLETSDGALWVNQTSRDWNFRSSIGLTKEQLNEVQHRCIRYKADNTAPKTFIDEHLNLLQAPAVPTVSWQARDKWSLTPSSEIEYSYSLNGEDWTQYSTANSARFPDLTSGIHTLRVRSRDTDWNTTLNIASTQFEIVPVLWKRPWFIIWMLLMVVLIVILITIVIKTRVAHLIEIREFKLWFFTQISHELRTPLSVILGPIDSLLQEPQSEKNRAALNMAQRNAQKMLHLVEQLLDFQKVEQSSFSPELTKIDIVEFVRESILAQKPLSQAKIQTLDFQTNLPSFTALLDNEKLQKILDNLISNAIKYTPENGNILVSLTIVQKNPQTPTAVISVSDNGIGVRKEDQVNIFKPFYRARTKSLSKVKGSGIGLALTSELVEICNGKIELTSPIYPNSSKRGGSRFTVELPMGQSIQSSDSPTNEIVSTETTALPELSLSHSASILIVDDNEDLRFFLKAELELNYQILQAENGVAALEIARTESPSLVITDVMMPEMDGNELCKQIKNDPEISHIPIIMLTARRSQRFQLMGLNNGADDYLTKPFSIEILKQRIHNILDSRLSLHEKFKKELKVSPQEAANTSLDTQFLEKALAIVERRISDPNLTAESFREDMDMQRMTLYRKLKALTGQSPKKFINTIRKKEAAKLLESTKLPLSEIPQKIGILEQSYFSHWFKREFDCSPSEFRRRVQK